jgi:trigger factor
LKVTKEKTGACEYTLNVEVEPERLVTPLRQAAQRLSKRRPLAGYRPGKAPYAMVERLYGKQLIVDEMLEVVGKELYQEALKDKGLDPYAVAHLDIVQADPLQLKFIVPVQPEVKLGDYHSIRVQQKPASVAPGDVDEVLERIRDANAVWAPIEREAKLGDQVQIDAVGTKVDGTKTEQKDLTLEITEELMPPEFRQNLLGMKAGESREFDVEYAADFRDKDLAGKRVHFAVTVKSAKHKELPALNDELAKSAGPYETLAQLRAKIEEELRSQKESEAKDAALTEALDALVAQASMEYPVMAVENETASMIQSYSERLQARGFTLQGYLDMMKKTPVQFHDEMRPQAERRLKRALALTKFAEAESVKVEPGEVQQEVDRLSQPYGEKAGDVKAIFSGGEPLRTITSDVFSRKAQDRLLAIATGQVESAAKEIE